MFTKIVLSAFSLLLVVSCGKKDDLLNQVTQESAAEQAGDVMASIDEASGDSSGGFSSIEREYKMFALMTPNHAKDLRVSSMIFPRASAVSCVLQPGWGSCTSSSRARSFNNCTIGGATLSGSVALAYSDSGCHVLTAGQTVSRSPNFTITGPQGATYTSSKSGSVGQRITVVSAGNYTFTNDGIRRVVKYNGATLADYSSATTSAMGIQGATRAGRVLNGGSLRVTNNSDSSYCDLVPSNVTWSASCNCPTSGQWTTTCTNGKNGTLVINSCGSGSFTLGGATSTVSFDRCSTN